MFKSYAPDVYGSLPDFAVTRNKASNVADSLAGIGDLISRRRLSSKVGFSLLHKHFDLSSNERLIEETGDNSTVVTPRPTDHKTAVSAYLWKAESTDEQDHYDWYPLEFMATADVGAVTQGVASSLESDVVLLDQIAADLHRLALEDVIGITLLHRDQIEIPEGNVLVEVTDHDARTLTWSPVPKDLYSSDELVQTVWRIEPDGALQSVGDCGHCLHCSGHCLHYETRSQREAT